MTAPFDCLTQALEVDDRFIQAEAARLLGELRRRDAVRPLVAYVSRFGWQTKLVGFHALAEIGDRRVVPDIRPLVSKPACFDDWYWYGCRGVRAAASVALLRLGDETGAPFLRELADAGHDVFYAWFAPSILRLPNDPPADAELKARITLDALFPPDKPRVRTTDSGVVTILAEALGLLASPAACEKLVELLAFRSRYTRGQAALSLLAAAPTKKHVAAVAKLAKTDKTDFARIKAHEALSLCHKATDGCHALTRPRGRACSRKESGHALPQTARKGMAPHGPSAGMAPSAPSVRMAPPGPSGGPAPSPQAAEEHLAAIARLADSAADPFDQAVAVESLGLLGAKEHTPLIRRKLSHEYAYVRRCALEALERLDPAAAREAAAAAANDSDAFVRLQAAKTSVAADGGNQ